MYELMLAVGYFVLGVIVGYAVKETMGNDD